MTHVLVVDDVADILETLCDTLKAVGYACQPVDDGREALDLIATNAEPCVVVLDYFLLGMSSSQVLRAIAEDPTLAARCIVVLFCMGGCFVQPEVIALVQRLSGLVLDRPFDEETLKLAVARAAARLNPPAI